MEFNALIGIFEISGWQALGKIPSPVSGKTEINIEAARNTIEILTLLKEKTRGNLEAGEEKLLSAVLANLQVNFASVKESEAQKKAGEGKKESGTGDAEATGRARKDEPDAREDAGREKSADEDGKPEKEPGPGGG